MLGRGYLEPQSLQTLCPPGIRDSERQKLKYDRNWKLPSQPLHLPGSLGPVPNNGVQQVTGILILNAKSVKGNANILGWRNGLADAKGVKGGLERRPVLGESNFTSCFWLTIWGAIRVLCSCSLPPPRILLLVRCLPGRCPLNAVTSHVSAFVAPENHYVPPSGLCAQENSVFQGDGCSHGCVFS